MYLLLNLALILTTFVMGSVFLVIPVPGSPGLKNYKISLKILAGAYYSFALLNSYVVYVDLTNDVPDYFNFIDLLISSVQTVLFVFTMITLFNPGFVTYRRIIKNLIPIAVFSIIHILFLIIFGDKPLVNLVDFVVWMAHPTSVVRLLFFVFFLGQLGYFSYLFFKEERNYLRHLEDFFSGTLRLQLKWLRYAFFSSLTIGLMSLALQVFPYKEFDVFFNAALIVFYFGFAIKYLNYNKLFSIIEPVLTSAPAEIVQQVKNKRSSLLWAEYKEAIVAEKLYLREGITLEELAQFLKIGRTTLSSLINAEEKVNFHGWINQLRVEESKKLFMEHPSYSIMRIAEMSGFSEHSNFSRQFKLVTGQTPSAWRNNQALQHQAQQ